MYTLAILEQRDMIRSVFEQCDRELRGKFDRCLSVKEYQSAIAILRDIQPDLFLVEETSSFPYADMLSFIRSLGIGCKLAIVGSGDANAILHAFRLGAFDYWSKADLFTELNGGLLRFLRAMQFHLISDLEAQLEILRLRLKLVRHQKFYEDALRDKDGRGLLADTDSQRSEYGIFFYAPYYTVMILHLSDLIQEPGIDAHKTQVTIHCLDRFLRDESSEAVYYVVPRGVIIILNHNHPLRDVFYKEIIAQLNQTESIYGERKKLMLGVSDTASSIQELDVLVEQAKCALDDRFFYPKCQVFYYSERMRASLLSLEQGVVNVLLPGQIDQLQSIAIKLDASKLGAQIRCLLMDSTSGQIFAMRTVVINHLLIRIFNDLSPDIIILGRNRAASKNPPPMPEDYDSVESVINAISNWIELCIQNILRDRETETNPAVLSAQYYIENHYMRDITLDEISAYVNLNPSYFSTLFRMHTGKRFLEYLRDYRLSEACKRLESSNRRLSDIATSVGIQNVNYFSKEFTKKYHMTPTQYRRQNYDDQ